MVVFHYPFVNHGYGDHESVDYPGVFRGAEWCRMVVMSEAIIERLFLKRPVLSQKF